MGCRRKDIIRTSTEDRWYNFLGINQVVEVSSAFAVSSVRVHRSWL